MEWEQERLRANVGLDELSSQHQVELARQNKQLNELKLQAEQRVRHTCIPRSLFLLSKASGSLRTRTRCMTVLALTVGSLPFAGT